MIKEVKVNAFFCDCCGRQMKDKNGANVYGDRIGQRRVEEGWYRNYATHKDYCPNCWHLEEKECVVGNEVKLIPFVAANNGEEFEYEW